MRVLLWMLVGTLQLCSWAILYISASKVQATLTEALFHYLARDAFDNVRNEPADKFVGSKEFDFIVVGAGSAGSIVANRLSEVPKWNVLLLEAGDVENNFQDIPLLANMIQFTDANWGYKTQPSDQFCLGLKKRRCHWPRGKVMGGSSTINYMIYTRGNYRDYDNWEDLGNKGWNWKDVLPYFKKVENFSVPEYMNDTKYHSTSGYMPISNPPYRTKIADAFVEAGNEMGLKTIDYNGVDQIGVNYLQVTMKDGVRSSSSRAYLHPVRYRKNMFVSKSSYATKIIIDPVTKLATGVEYTKGGKTYIAKARKEVIVSCGTINSPQLLMLSGIGPKDHLTKKDIPVIKNLKVGFNLKDHPAPGGLTYTIKKPISVRGSRIVQNAEELADYLRYHTGPISIPGGCEAILYYDSQNGSSPHGLPDLELFQVSGSINSDETLKACFNLNEDIYNTVYRNLPYNDSLTIFPMPLRPKSVGRIMLKDKNPNHKPLIFPNYYSDKEGYDIKMSIIGIRKANEMVKAAGFRELGTELVTTPLPGCAHLTFDSDAYWECYTRHMTFTIYHHIGTCKMGPPSDKDAVVDPRLRVYGIKNLRVIDASVMPEMPSGHTNAPTMMIAEKGSDMIKQDWGVRIDPIS